jgi:hypothetical protein
VPVPEDHSVKTIQVSNIDGVVHGDSLDLRRMIYQIFEGTGLVGETPEIILKTYLDVLKLDSMRRPGVIEKMDTDLRYREFFLSNGNASTNYKEYYNKTFTFGKWERENGSVLLIHRKTGQIEPLFQDVIADSIRKEEAGQPPNRLTKRQILAEVFKRFRAPLFLDVGCCEMELADDPANDMTLDEYVERGTLGGKSKRKKKKKTRRSKKTIRIK